MKNVNEDIISIGKKNGRRIGRRDCFMAIVFDAIASVN